MPLDMSVTVPSPGSSVFFVLVALECGEDASGLTGTSLAFGMSQCF